MPRGRTAEYAVWRACERLGLKPPNVKPEWDENAVEIQAKLIAYSQIRDIEDLENATLSFQTKHPKI